MEDTEVVEAFADTLVTMAAGRAGAWTDRSPGLLLAAVRAPLPTLNGVVCWGGRTGPGTVAHALDRVADEGFPQTLYLAAGDTALGAVAARRGWVRGEDAALMRLDAVPRAPTPPGLTVRVLRPDEWRTHTRVAAEGFEAPVALFDDLTEPLASHPDLVMVVGERDGRPVTTALGLLGPRGAGLFDVGTPPEHRRRGYGAAATAALVAECRARGAPWVWLQPSAAGLPVYRGLGFRTAAVLQTWGASGSPDPGAREG
jgi:GNAT superfamily N-acetyltransferase